MPVHLDVAIAFCIAASWVAAAIGSGYLAKKRRAWSHFPYFAGMAVIATTVAWTLTLDHVYAYGEPLAALAIVGLAPHLIAAALMSERAMHAKNFSFTFGWGALFFGTIVVILGVGLRSVPQEAVRAVQITQVIFMALTAGMALIVATFIVAPSEA